MSSNTNIYPIYDERSLLLANKALVKVSKRNVLMSNLTNVRSLVGLLICSYSYLLSAVTSFFLRLIT